MSNEAIRKAILHIRGCTFFTSISKNESLSILKTTNYNISFYLQYKMNGSFCFFNIQIIQRDYIQTQAFRLHTDYKYNIQSVLKLNIIALWFNSTNREYTSNPNVFYDKWGTSFSAFLLKILHQIKSTQSTKIFFKSLP